jgi:SAM-dependent MidA family methyltransferase
MGKYIEESKELYAEAKREFESGKIEKDYIKLRDACEKAWGSIVLATNELFEKKSIPIAKSPKERREGLDRLEQLDRDVKEKGISDRYSARDNHLHRQGFYEGICEPALIEPDIEKVERYIRDIAEL